MNQYIDHLETVWGHENHEWLVLFGVQGDHGGFCTTRAERFPPAMRWAWAVDKIHLPGPLGATKFSDSFR